MAVWLTFNGAGLTSHAGYGLGAGGVPPLPPLPPMERSGIRGIWANGTEPSNRKGDKYPVYNDAGLNIWDVVPQRGTYDMQVILLDDTNLVEIIDADTTGIKYYVNAFQGCTGLVRVRKFEVHGSNVSIQGMFDGCTALEEVALFDTSNVRDMERIFRNCSSLRAIPDFALDNIYSMAYAFEGCTSVHTGALSLYNKAASLSPEPVHDNTFNNTGVNDPAGYQELLQIPESWGGLGA